MNLQELFRFVCFTVKDVARALRTTAELNLKISGIKLTFLLYLTVFHQNFSKNGLGLAQLGWINPFELN